LGKDSLDGGSSQPAEDSAGGVADGLVQAICAVEYVAGQLGEIVTSSPAMAPHQGLPRLVRDVCGCALGNEHSTAAFEDVEA
jgi:hypothetical protein